MEPVVVTPEQEEITSLKALWTYIQSEPNTSTLEQWFWHRVSDLNIKRLNDQLKEMMEETYDGENRGS